MKKSILISSFAAIAAAIVTTACSTPPTTVDTGPSPSGFSTLPAPAASAADSAIATAKKFGAERIDVVTAHAALESGRPVLVGLPDGAVRACHSALLVPGDPKVWILNTTGAPGSAGHTLDRELLQYGCDSGVERPASYPMPAPAPNAPLNEAAKAAAAAAKAPFIYGMPDGGERACHSSVVLPSGDAWFRNRSGGATATGDALDRTIKEYGCTGVTFPDEGGAR